MAILHEVSDYELRVRLQEPEFADRVRQVLQAFENYLSEKSTWGQANAPALLANPVAYFTAEFGFHETLPIAAGGLGILAGDHAKSASDLGLGFVGVSLFYREGYFQQSVNQDNWQIDYYTLLNPMNLPIEPVLAPSGEPLVCSVESLTLRPSLYKLSAKLFRSGEVVDELRDVEFEILPSDFFGIGSALPQAGPPLLVRQLWKVDPSTATAPQVRSVAS